MTDAQKYRMRLVRAHMDYIRAEINDVNKMIENMISSNPDFENTVQFLCTIPGVKRDSAITIISEIGTPPINVPVPRVRVQTNKGSYFNSGSTNTGVPASKPPTYPTHHVPRFNDKL